MWYCTIDSNVGQTGYRVCGGSIFFKLKFVCIARVSGCPLRPEDSIASLAVGVADCCKLPNVDCWEISSEEQCMLLTTEASL